jgi:hypothetical protein
MGHRDPTTVPVYKLIHRPEDAWLEEPMNLPNDISLKIEKSPDKEDILLLLARLESDGVTITHDVYAAIVATLEYTKLGAIE